MADIIQESPVPIPEKTLRDLSKDFSVVLPNLPETDAIIGLKNLYAIIGPLLDTADSADLSSSHRAAVYNILCAVIDRCQSSTAQYARDAILDECIWNRLFNIYLTRSDNSKSKPIRQILVTLTSVLIKNVNTVSAELQAKAVAAFLDVICERQDRSRVKPSLQGLAHFIQKGVVTPDQLVDIYNDLLQRSPIHGRAIPSASFQTLFATFLTWIVHHDTALSAGHVVRNFLGRYRESLQAAGSESQEKPFPFWIEPTVETLRVWPDRIQEFKTHVFPYCFQPNLKEYLQFLSYLHFDQHVNFKGDLPSELQSLHLEKRGQAGEGAEEFRVLLAAIESGKELGIVKDVDYRINTSIQVCENAIILPDSIFAGWLSHQDIEVRLAGLYLSIVSSAATRPVTSGARSSLRRNIMHLHAETDANFRRELLSYTQKLFDRLRGSTATLARQTAKNKAVSQERSPFPKEALDVSNISQNSQSQDLLIDSLRFIVWYIRVLEWDLRLEASYQRRITAVRALIVVLKSGIDPHVPRHLLSKGAQGQLGWVHGLSIPNSKLVRSLLDLVLDPFDDIRDASVSALQLCLEASSDVERKAALARLPGFISRAEAMMLRTGRADQADGVARAYSLYFSCSTDSTANDAGIQSGTTSKLVILTHLNEQLKDTLAIAVGNLSEAVNGQPVHGTFAAIRYIIDQEGFYSGLSSLSGDQFMVWKNIHDEILRSIELLWPCVWNILCADAPEGHIPEELEDEASLGTKEILSYSWRGLKEASVLLRGIITRCPIGRNERSLLDVSKVEKLGDLCFSQLVELRHRGAFSTVAQTFAAFCRRCVSADEPMLRALPEKWYTETLSTIQAKANTITRRSGGLPALMTGIVAAESQPGGKLFAQAMQDLVAEASISAESSNIEESRLPQVHALNCIKDFFMSSKLSIASEAYLGEGLELAAKTLNSKIWPIRNCSLMLFRALIERLLGSDEAQDWKEREGVRTSRFSFGSYPSLIGILQKLLDPEGPLKESLSTPNSNSPMDLHGAEGVFPALQILRQTAPPEENRVAILKSVERLLDRPHWHMRDMAARTATTLHLPQEYQQTIKAFLKYNGTSTNWRHGALLCSKFMLKRLLQTATKLDPPARETDRSQEMLLEVMVVLNDVAEQHISHKCSLIRGAFLDLVSMCGMAMLYLPSTKIIDTTWAQLTKTISIGPEYELGTQHEAHSSLFRQSLAKIFFIDRFHHQHSEPAVPLNQAIGDALILLANEDTDTCLTALDTLDEIFQVRKTPRSLWPRTNTISDVFQLVLHAKDAEVLSKAQTVLADALSASFTLALKEEDLPLILSKLEAQCLNSSPSNMRGALRLLACTIDQTYHLYPSRHETLWPQISRYIRLLRMGIIDTNPFDDRFATVQSIASLYHLWTMDRASKPTSTLSLGLTFVLYDLLNDDDEEIRDMATIATTRLIQPYSNSPTSSHTVKSTEVPLLTSHHLATFLIKTFATHPYLHKEALRRLTLSPTTATPLTPLATTLSSVLTPVDTQQTALLFATEKQNLYKDDTLDAALWSRLLSSLPPSTLSTSLRRDLTTWTRDALRTLVETAKREGDGDVALGWISKGSGDVFSLGLRAIYAADVVVKWGSSAANKEDAEEVRKLLGLLASGGREGEGKVHLLWKEKAEGVLEGHVMRMLKGFSVQADELGFGL